MIDSGWVTILYPFDDSQKLAEVTQTALAQPELLIEFGRAGRQRVLDEFSLQRTQQQYQEIYEDFGTSV
ncbi:glycosyltransferase [Agarivorans aestuarii]|uniref:glycosyltransferase n=1 Tax=Agarivorans aestuarii TaxID=1563703 RepID=UPI001C80DCE3|nr:hypothetical protein [Agarivorans aestuarii]